MTEAVTVQEAMVFCRAPAGSTGEEFRPLIDNALSMVEVEVGHSLTSVSPSPLRLAVLLLVLRQYDGRDAGIDQVMPWIAPYKSEAA